MMDTVQLIMQLQSRRGTDPVVIYDPVTERYLEIDYVDTEHNRVVIQARGTESINEDREA